MHGGRDHHLQQHYFEQGRITKVLNMKPPEILGMIEEAAGTRMVSDGGPTMNSCNKQHDCTSTQLL